jgi:hypothetical protein
MKGKWLATFVAAVALLWLLLINCSEPGWVAMFRQMQLHVRSNDYAMNAVLKKLHALSFEVSQTTVWHAIAVLPRCDYHVQV